MQVRIGAPATRHSKTAVGRVAYRDSSTGNERGRGGERGGRLCVSERVSVCAFREPSGAPSAVALWS